MEKRLFNNEWKIVETINEGKFSTVYKAINDSGDVCAIKHISFPPSKEELDKIIEKGLAKDHNDANNYFLNVFNR